MANNGNKQATIAYKTTPDGQALDVAGQLTSISGNRQAVALLQGTANPNPAIYEVQFYYAPGATLQGTPTVSADVEDCPIYFIRVSENRIVLHPGNVSQEITVFSSNAWAITAQGDNATVVPAASAEGATVVNFTRSGNIGDQLYVFTNSVSGQSATVHVINVDSLAWILETGDWNNLGFWFDNGIWNY